MNTVFRTSCYQRNTRCKQPKHRRSNRMWSRFGHQGIPVEHDIDKPCSRSFTKESRDVHCLNGRQWETHTHMHAPTRTNNTHARTHARTAHSYGHTQTHPETLAHTAYIRTHTRNDARAHMQLTCTHPRAIRKSTQQEMHKLLSVKTWHEHYPLRFWSLCLYFPRHLHYLGQIIKQVL